MQQVQRLTLSRWSLWFDDDANWRDGPQCVTAAIDGDIDAWKVVPPTAGWSVLDQGIPVVVPSVTDDQRPGYHGVSWWSTEVDLDFDCLPVLKFGAARLLAEVFWDRELVGIDLEGYTPFEMLVPEHLGRSGRHRIDVRITNPGGVTGWEDVFPFAWGPLRLPSSHDLGGLWQPVTLELATSARISDVWARPNRDLDAALVDVTVCTEGPATLVVELRGPAGALVVATEVAVDRAGTQQHSVSLPITQPDLYGPGAPNLYAVVASLTDAASSDEVATKIGFRLLDAAGSSLQLNGEPFYLRTAISWGRYGTESIATEQELRNEVESLLALGQNAVSAHRMLATPALADALEAAGLLLYQEPGGLPSLRSVDSRFAPETEIADTVQLMEKRIRRLARRDRNRACLVWWNLGNEMTDLDDGDPGSIGWRLLRALRDEDDSRITTFSSAWGPTPLFRPFAADPAALFDYHTVQNWPASWHEDIAGNYLALRPPRPMPMLSGESVNMGGLMWIARAAEEPATELGETGAAQRWAAAIDRDLRRLDPDARLGGAAQVCARTGDLQTYSMARLVEANRANPDIDGLVINAWHSHSMIGTMGLTGPDRRVGVDPEPVRSANGETAVALQRIQPVVLVGESQRVGLVLFDDTHAFAGEVDVHLSQRDESGRCSVDAFSVTVAATGERVRHLADVDLTATSVGLVTIDVTVRVGDRTVGTQSTFRGVDRPRLDGVALAVHDPASRLSRFVSDSGLDASAWHTYVDAPILLTSTNLDPWPATMSGPATRVICVLDAHETQSYSAAAMELRGYGFASDPQAAARMDEFIDPFVPVTGHWTGGWGLTVDPQMMTTLAETRVWDWTVNSLLPTRAMRHGAVVDRALTGAITFPDADVFTMGDPRVFATTVLRRRGSREFVVTTMPLIEKVDRDPLAAAVLSDLIRWAADRPAGNPHVTGTDR